MADKKMGLGTLEGHKTHISILWVIALLAIATFVTVAYYVYAGQQQDLGERHFDEVRVDKFVKTDRTLSLTSGGTSTQNSVDGDVTVNAYTGVVTLTTQTIGTSNSITDDLTFTVNNDKVTANDVVVLSTGLSPQAEQLVCTAGDVTAGSFKITCKNTGTTMTDFAGPINFVVIKGSTS